MKDKKECRERTGGRRRRAWPPAKRNGRAVEVGKSSPTQASRWFRYTQTPGGTARAKGGEARPQTGATPVAAQADVIARHCRRGNATTGCRASAWRTRQTGSTAAVIGRRDSPPHRSPVSRRFLSVTGAQPSATEKKGTCETPTAVSIDVSMPAEAPGAPPPHLSRTRPKTPDTRAPTFRLPPP